MFPFDADCADCRSFMPKIEKNGRFYCEKKGDYVSANARICPMASEVMGRPKCDKDVYRKISKSHGYYVVTAISEILGLDSDNQYMESFKYLRDVVLPSSEEYGGFIDDYEEDGPALATLIREDPERENYAEYLRVTFLNGMVSLFCQNDIVSSINLYEAMLETMKDRYDYQRQNAPIKEKKAVGL